VGRAKLTSGGDRRLSRRTTGSWGSRALSPTPTADAATKGDWGLRWAEWLALGRLLPRVREGGTSAAPFFGQAGQRLTARLAPSQLL
jgi:hypothetical protein